MATEVLEHCHHVLFDDISVIFDLKKADKNHLVGMVKTLIDGYRHTDVREYYYYIHHSSLNYVIIPQLIICIIAHFIPHLIIFIIPHLIMLSFLN